MKGKFVIFSFTFIMLLMMLCGCKSSSDDDIVSIDISDEAKAYEEDVLVEGGEKAFLTEEYFDMLLAHISDREEQLLPECDVENNLEKEKCGGSNVYTLSDDDYENVILYLHGGAWSIEISEEHVTFCDSLATKLNAKVYMPLYPLAPEAESDDTYAMIEKLYKEIVKEGKNVYIMGDSAGGNLALGLMYTIKEENLVKPDKMVLIAPCSDMSFSNEQMADIEETDPVLAVYGCLECAKMWAGEDNLKDPKNSALYADLTGYPDTLLIQGTNDILYPDNYSLYEKMKDEGVNVKFVEGKGLWHVFPVDSIPEQDEVLDIIKEFTEE